MDSEYLQGVRAGSHEVIEAVANDYGVFIVEGEKDVDNLAHRKVPATTCPGGAGKWRDEYNESLRGADVVLIPDNDKAGRDHVDQVGRALTGIAKRVFILDLAKIWPACPEKATSATGSKPAARPTNCGS